MEGGHFDLAGNWVADDPLSMPNEHQVTEQKRAAHANYAAHSGDWASYFACWDTTRLGSYQVNFTGPPGFQGPPQFYGPDMGLERSRD